MHTPERSKSRFARAECASIAQQIQIWMADRSMTGLPPTFTLQRLTAFPNPYLRPKDLVDPWGRPHQLLVCTSRDFQVVSFGEDGLLGGSG